MTKGVLVMYVLQSVSVIRTSMMQSVLVFHRPLTKRSPRSSEGRSVVGDDGC